MALQVGIGRRFLNSPKTPGNTVEWTTDVPVFPNIATDYLAWEATLTLRDQQFQAHCPITRPTTYYFSQSGDDSTGDGSEGSPWKTIAKANTEMAADTAFLFNRGDIWEDGTQLTVDENNVTIGAYGTGERPIFNKFNNKLLAADNEWTSVSGDTWSTTVTGTIGWIVKSDDRRGDDGVFMRQVWTTNEATTVAAMEASGFMSWAQNSTTLYVRLGSGIDPNDFDLETSLSNRDSGVQINNGVTGIRVTGLEILGYSLDIATGNHNDGYGIIFLGNANETCYVDDCVILYGSSHVAGHLYSFAGSGGKSFWKNNIIGYAKYGGTSETILNAYSASGVSEFYAHTNTIYGTLPESVWSPDTNKRRGRAIYSHTAGSDSDTLAMYGNIIPDRVNGGAADDLGGFANTANVTYAGDYLTVADTAAFKSFSVKNKQGPYQVLGLDNLYMSDSQVYYGNAYFLKPLTRASGALWTGRVLRQFWANNIVDIDWENQSDNNMSIYNGLGSAPRTNTFKQINNFWIGRNYNGTNTSNRTSFDYDNNYDNGSGASNLAEFVNSVSAVEKNNNGIVYLGLHNTSENIRSSAFFGHNETSTGNRSYSNGTDNIILSTLPAVGYPYTDLLEAGQANEEGVLLSHDINGKARTTGSTPDVGPVDFSSNPKTITSIGSASIAFGFDFVNYTLIPQYHADTEIGDLAILLVANGGTVSVTETPSGDTWNYLGTATGDDDSTVRVYTKTYNALDEAAKATLNTDLHFTVGNVYSASRMLTFRGALTAPYTVAIADSDIDANTATSPSVTTTLDDSKVLRVALGHAPGDGWTTTPTGDLILDVDIGVDMRAVLQDAPTAGAQGTTAFEHNNASEVNLSIAINRG